LSNVKPPPESTAADTVVSTTDTVTAVRPSVRELAWDELDPTFTVPTMVAPETRDVGGRLLAETALLGAEGKP
jgi:hypothetical protein